MLGSIKNECSVQLKMLVYCFKVNISLYTLCSFC